jgi:mannose-1-phosphate guanylyltransferase
MTARDQGRDERWALILAGGDGQRLRPLTRIIAGDERPKQFCRILGGRTLLAATESRVALVVPPSRTLVALTRAHERYYGPLVEGRPPRSLLIQPENRGTAPAILYGALRIARDAPLGAMAVFPTDHYVSDDARFMAHVAAAFDAVSKRPELVVLLGIVPQSAETEYGWIEPAEQIPGTLLLRVGSFHEKPTPALAQELLGRHCLWNSFVLVARIPALLALFSRYLPGLMGAFAGVQSQLDAAGEERAAQVAYKGLAPVSFSDAVLSARPANLATLPVDGVQWSDWGHPRRILATLSELENPKPEWAERAALALT